AASGSASCSRSSGARCRPPPWPGARPTNPMRVDEVPAPELPMSPPGPHRRAGGRPAGGSVMEAREETVGAPAYTSFARGEPGSPAGLAARADPPARVPVWGGALPEWRAAVAIVGSRAATPYGLAIADRLARDLAVHGVAVVSGLARGIDTAAHAGT